MMGSEHAVCHELNQGTCRLTRHSPSHIARRTPDCPGRRIEQRLETAHQIGMPTAEIGIETLEDRLRKAAIAVHGQGTLPLQFCGWVRV
jgi:hypothetical protein